MTSLWQTIRSFFAPALPVQKVGFLCSVTQPEAQKFLQAFKAALGATPVNPKYANGRYRQGDRTLITLAKELMDGTDKVDVIAAVGGATSLEAAVQAAKEFETAGTPSKIPIIFIGDKIIPHANISGGINLNMPSYHQQRVDALRSKQYGATKVGLLVNYNAAIGPQEEAGWDSSWGPVQPVGKAEDNAHIDLRKAIDHLLRAGADGIIVASDPYFTRQRNLLVELLNDTLLQTNKAVCYPFDSYKDDVRPGLRPTAGKSLRFGVSLDDQYRVLGTKANAVLTALRSAPGTIPNVGVDQITSTAIPW